MQCDAGVRFDNRTYVSFQLDTDTGDMFITLNLFSDEDVPFVVTGQVQWDEE